ncbi:hypothetical protein ETD96_40370, partial [Actinomadura geliboluensis]
MGRGQGRGVPGEDGVGLVLEGGGDDEAAAREGRRDLVARPRRRQDRERLAVQAADAQLGGPRLDEDEPVGRRRQHRVPARQRRDLLAALDVQDADRRVAGQADEGAGGGRGVQDPAVDGRPVAEPDGELGQPLAGEGVPHDHARVAGGAEDGDDGGAPVVDGEAEEVGLPVEHGLVPGGEVVDMHAVAVRPGDGGGA